jgi:DNA repair protein RadC
MAGEMPPTESVGSSSVKSQLAGRIQASNRVPVRPAILTGVAGGYPPATPLFQEVFMNEEKKDGNLADMLAEYGPRYLSTVELVNLAIGFSNGKRLDTDTAIKVGEALERTGKDLDTSDVIKIPGIGKNRATRLVAAMELARRFNGKGSVKIQGPEDVMAIVHDILEEMQEHFIVLDLDGAGCLIQKRIVFKGSLNQTMVHPREVVSGALRCSCAGMVLVHNHPSGASEPSREDVAITERLVRVGKLIGIEIVDHVIVSRNGFYSFKAEGMLSE